jgi:ABC-type nitrate/sulfonate/bicarbonate transport system permease component
MNDGRELFLMDQVILGMLIIGFVGFALNTTARVFGNYVMR